MLIVDGILAPTRDHTVAEQSKNYRHSTSRQVVIDADTRLVVVVGRPMPGNRNDCRAWEESGAKAAVGTTMTIADGGYPGTGLVRPTLLVRPLRDPLRNTALSLAGSVTGRAYAPCRRTRGSAISSR